MKNINPTSTRSWKILTNHFNKIKDIHMIELFNADDLRFQKFSITFKNQILVDFSKNRITGSTITKLLNLVEEIDLKCAIESLFTGKKINRTENRAVLHTALRNRSQNPIFCNNRNIMIDVILVLKKMKKFSHLIINGYWKGFTGKAITDIVNVGIGGSDLGPLMVIEALKSYRNHLNFHFVSNIDGTCVYNLLKKIKIETTLFLIVSKSFDTQETIMNANTIKNWILKKFPNTNYLDKHFIAITTNKRAAISFGIKSDNIFMFWDWVGGRFSIWSSVGLSIILAIGFRNFELLLEGAYEMDQHFLNADWNKNIPVLLALIHVWYNNFFKTETEAVLVYDQNMYRFASFLQQTNMESNGKSVDRNNNFVTWQTGPIIWGEPGTNGQHAFYQLLHQGTKLIPCDFIASVIPNHPLIDHHERLISHFFSQTRALAFGTSSINIDNKKIDLMSKDTNKNNSLSIHKLCQGNKPSNSIFLRQLTPFNLGSLIALYEHKVFTQGVIFNIFSFDQWGVQLGKSISENIFNSIQCSSQKNSYDDSTNELINFYKRFKKV